MGAQPEEDFFEQAERESEQPDVAIVQFGQQDAEHEPQQRAEREGVEEGPRATVEAPGGRRFAGQESAEEHCCEHERGQFRDETESLKWTVSRKRFGLVISDQLLSYEQSKLWCLLHKHGFTKLKSSSGSVNVDR